MWATHTLVFRYACKICNTDVQQLNKIVSHSAGLELRPTQLKPQDTPI